MDATCNGISKATQFFRILLGALCFGYGTALSHAEGTVESGGIGDPVWRSDDSHTAIPAAQTPIPAGVPQFFPSADPTDHEQLMLEYLNRARANPGAEAARLGIGLNEGLDPGTIEDTPKQPLAFHQLLIDAARDHSAWMLDTNTFSHTGENGSDVGDRIEDAGYVFLSPWSWGENIAWGGTTGTPDLTEFTIARHDGLFLSPGHRVNICNNTFNEIGLGVLEGQFTNEVRTWNAVMATQKFALSAATPGPLLLGVVYTDADGNDFYSPGEGVSGITIRPQGGDWYTVTSDSGGYAVPYPDGDGTMEVLVSGGPLSHPRTVTLDRTGQNIKFDLDLSGLSDVRFVRDSLSHTPGEGFRMEVTGLLGSVFDLQYSFDLASWTTVDTYQLETSSRVLTHDPDGEENTVFYRLRWTE